MSYKMKSYKEFLISFQPFNVDLISGLLWNLKIEGIVEDNSFIKVYTLAENNILESDFDKILLSSKRENLIESFFISSSDVENKNWNEEWEKKIQVIKVTDKIIIKPSFRNYMAAKDEIVITIDPKMSFGTGEHETTKLMLQFVEKYVYGNSKICDVGSGTAVLSIASYLLGAQKVIAIDNDELCLDNGLENTKINNAEGHVDVLNCELKDLNENNFDIILANINKHILIDIAKEMKTRIKSEGILILSGLLNTDQIEIINHYSKFGFELIDKRSMNEWISIVLKATF